MKLFSKERLRMLPYLTPLRTDKVFEETNNIMGVKLVTYSLFLNRKEIGNNKYVSFLIPYLIRNKEWFIVAITFSLFNKE